MRTTAPLILMSIFATSCASAALSARPPGSRSGQEPILESPAERYAQQVVTGLHGPARRATYQAFSDGFRQAIPLEQLGRGLDELVARLGPLRGTAVLDRSSTPDGTTVYVAAYYLKVAQLFVVTLDNHRSLLGLRVASFVPDDPKKGPGPADDYVTKRLYQLPAAGVWLVFNGGRDAKRNGHVGNRQQWYAYDLVRPAELDKSHAGDGKRVEDYPAWGSEVLAPAAGKVVAVVEGVADHGLEHTDLYFVPGNLVVLDHGDGEFSFLAHFRDGSIVVAVGDQVRQGQKLGQVGNSGNSSEPHIHWHLATDADISKGHGLPIRWGQHVVNGTQVEQPEPHRSDRVERMHPAGPGE